MVGIEDGHQFCKAKSQRPVEPDSLGSRFVGVAANETCMHADNEANSREAVMFFGKRPKMPSAVTPYNCEQQRLT